MIRKTVMALALASVFAAPMSPVYAESDEEKKPESANPQLIAEDHEKKPESQLIAESDQKETSKPELIADSHDEKKPESPSPQVIA